MKKLSLEKFNDFAIDDGKLQLLNGSLAQGSSMTEQCVSGTFFTPDLQTDFYSDNCIAGVWDYAGSYIDYY